MFVRLFTAIADFSHFEVEWSGQNSVMYCDIWQHALTLTFVYTLQSSQRVSNF